LNALGPEEKKKAFEHIIDAYQLGKALEVQVTADAMLEAQFDESMASSIEEVTLEFDDPNSEGSLEFINITTRSKSGQTRLCLEPWSYMLFAQNGEVFSCCVGYPAVAKIDENSTLEDIYNSPGNQQVRRELLTGELTEHCATCPRKANVSPEELRGHVTNFLHQAQEQAAASPRLPVLPPAAVDS
jgi:radical SAM protein with 4Fe4S-binding SPASM domain